MEHEWNDQTWDDYYALHKTRCSDAHMGACPVLPPVPSVMRLLESVRADERERAVQRVEALRPNGRQTEQIATVIAAIKGDNDE